ncbi:MAG: hypothetical protein ACI8UO_006082, partial [Verrucomicrobiales bacterium]
MIVQESSAAIFNAQTAAGHPKNEQMNPRYR